jgi:cellulose synthase/poly-beta-1,6-N-acetylglucosamine synthase-like glycosyltransferase
MWLLLLKDINTFITLEKLIKVLQCNEAYTEIRKPSVLAKQYKQRIRTYLSLVFYLYTYDIF